MPYYRRRASSRRGSRRKSRTLSSYQIATRTSARAQSRQIYALNRKIRRIEATTRPETLVACFDPRVVTPSSRTDSAGPFSSTAGYSYATDYVMKPTIEGLFARQNNAMVYFNANYVTMSNDVQPVTYRVLVVQTTTTIENSIPFGNIWNDMNTSASNSNTTTFGWGNSFTNEFANGAIFGPLQDGITRTVKILADRRYTLSYQRPQVAATIKLKRLMNMGLTEVAQSSSNPENPSADASIYGKGVVHVLVMAFGLSAHTYRIAGKIAYTDA